MTPELLEAMNRAGTVIARADALGEIEDLIRHMEAARDRMRGELAHAMCNAEMDAVVSTTGKTYKLSRPPARYTFSVPEEELAAHGILEDCTPPPAPPKLTKTKLDELLKRRRLEDATVVEWQQKGWYVIERSDEITVRQVETKPEVLKATLGF